MTADTLPRSPFEGVNAELAALRGRPPLPPGDGHRDLAPGIWLSSEPAKGSLLSIAPVERGFKLTLQDVGRAKWVALGFGVPVDGLRQCRLLGVRVRAVSDGFLSYRPCLRFVRREGGFVDRFPTDYVISSGGLREQMGYVEVEQTLVAEARAAEINLFFQGTSFDAEFELIEVLQIL